MKVSRNLTVEKIIKELLTSGHKFKRKKYTVSRLTCCPRVTYCRMAGIPEVPPEGRELIFARGRAHHGVLEVFKPSEVIVNKDEIRGDIDMIGARVTEVFTTTMSSKKVEKPDDVAKVFKLKTSQLKAYLYMIEDYKGDLLVFFLFGDYARLKILPNGKVRYTGIIPQLRDWTMIFEKDELRRNWDELLTKRDIINECLQTKVPESVLTIMPKLMDLWDRWRNGELSKDEIYSLIARRDFINNYLNMPDWTGEEWECKNCGYAFVCPEWNKEVAGV